MPFINGRYYVNPIMGEALEAAREAEAALLALENRSRQNSGGASVDDSGDAAGDGFGDGSQGSGGASGAHGGAGAAGPIHRVEIEAAELVPAHSGRAARGYVARVHRQPAEGAPSNTPGAQSHGGRVAPRAGAGGGAIGPRGTNAPGHAETHVFADHRDLVSFLRDELAKDSHSQHR